jgi:hypothetical protein
LKKHASEWQRDIVDSSFHASAAFGLTPILGLSFPKLWGGHTSHTTVTHCIKLPPTPTYTTLLGLVGSKSVDFD